VTYTRFYVYLPLTLFPTSGDITESIKLHSGSNKVYWHKQQSVTLKNESPAI
jgi:hypothetical protein